MRLKNALLLGAALAASGMLALTAIQEGWKGKDGGRVQTALAQGHPARITPDNLVDRLAVLPLSQRLQRVQWQQAVLAIDLEAAADATQLQLASDLLRLLQLGFVYPDNVDRMLVRVLAASPSAADEAPVLLLAADVRKGDETLHFLPVLQARDVLGGGWDERLRLTRTAAWRMRFDR
ncbi:hypothetical protein IDH44_08195 [Paenibacillus sp. IB182496]|uniref:Uncharacterized protein n=1 Tax=Paenibacillus sabuli TaxID=2772509 RepID=A0A927BT30_9BACL|nr:hypothetical protein [Paenibacillus sabuli]MBD2845170.1 hypothetical protein [Paenibacillus sabuli]